MTVNVVVVYYSSGGTVHRLAEAVTDGATAAGAHVRLLRAPELAPKEAIDTNPRWRAHLDSVDGRVPEATHDDLEWADAYAFGTPTRFGNVAAQLKQFLDSTASLWFRGVFADKAVTSFTSAINTHGGNEATLLSLNNVFCHWGSIIVPPGYTDSSLYAAGGNPYGTSFVTGPGGDLPGDVALEAARYQGRRLVEIGTRLATPTAAPAAAQVGS